MESDASNTTRLSILDKNKQQRWRSGENSATPRARGRTEITSSPFKHLATKTEHGYQSHLAFLQVSSYDKTSTSTLGHTFLGQVEQTKDEEPFPFEIVAPVIGIVVLACSITVVDIMCRKRRKLRVKQNTEVCDTGYDNDANAASTDDMAENRETLPVRHYSVHDTGDMYAQVNKASTSQTDLSNPATEYANVPLPTSRAEYANVPLPTSRAEYANVPLPTSRDSGNYTNLSKGRRCN
ncbi:hypothetical protein ScPMuIL_012042 [Solemya velum]